MKFTKKQCNLFARLFIANSCQYIDFAAFSGQGLTREQEQSLIDAVDSLCIEIVKDHPLNLGSTKMIIDYIKLNEK